MHERPLHSVKIGVRCDPSQQRIIGPIFFSETVNSECYINIIYEFLGHLTEDEIKQGWFQQDGATSRTSRSSMNELGLLFGDSVVSKSLWPPRSPDLTSPDCFLWAYLKDVVYTTKPCPLGELKAIISDTISNIPQEILHSVSESMLRRMNLCLQIGGGHF